MDPHTFQPWCGVSHGRQKSSSRTAGQTAGQTAGISQPVQSSPASVGGVGADLISANTLPWDGREGECNICLSAHDETSLSLSQCGHTYHLACLQQLLQSSASTFLQCPTCKKVYGVKQGTMPTTGSVSHRLLPTTLPGYETAAGCIEITFVMRGGLQVGVTIFGPPFLGNF